MNHLCCVAEGRRGVRRAHKYQVDCWLGAVDTTQTICFVLYLNTSPVQ